MGNITCWWTRVKRNVKLLKLNYEVLHREVKVHHTDDKGKVKELTEQYVVNAVSVTDAEVKVTKDFEGSGVEFEVGSVIETKIIKVIK